LPVFIPGPAFVRADLDVAGKPGQSWRLVIFQEYSMVYSATNTEHSGDKRSCSSYCGRRAEDEAGSRVKRRAADGAIVRAQAQELGQTMPEAANGQS
jgi:hypothetical protein